MKPTALRSIIFGVPIVLAVSASGLVLAHQGATGIVKERMDLMSRIGAASKTVADMLLGAKPYSADAAREAALTIKQHAGETMTALFPEGSLDAPSRATPAVWQDWDKFAELAQELSERADTMAAIAENGNDGKTPPELRSAFLELNFTCSACHQNFRTED